LDHFTQRILQSSLLLLSLFADFDCCIRARKTLSTGRWNWKHEKHKNHHPTGWKFAPGVIQNQFKSSYSEVFCGFRGKSQAVALKSRLNQIVFCID
jgi:hypothetical protein